MRAVVVLFTPPYSWVIDIQPKVFLSSRPRGRRLPPPCVLEEERADDARGDADTAEDGDAHEPLLGDLCVDELAQVRGLEVGGLAVEEEVVVAAGLAVVTELVVAQGEVVEAFAAALGGEAEDVGEETDAELLVVAAVGLDEALCGGKGVSRVSSTYTYTHGGESAWVEEGGGGEALVGSSRGGERVTQA